MPLSIQVLLLSLCSLFAALLTIATIMKFSHAPPSFFAAALSSLPFTTAQNGHSSQCGSSNTDISLDWHAPAKTKVNNLASAINGTGTYGFIFNTSQSPPDTDYNWCNMPHTNPTTYRVPPADYHLEYVEVIHRHHKRTPYADNTFPQESYPWDCSDEGLFYGGKPLNPTGNASAATYWDVYTSDINPFPPQGFPGTCQFPQITRGGLDDSHQHGVDLEAVYADQLSFLPADYDPDLVEYRVTNNPITSQVAAMLTAGMYPSLASTSLPLRIQPSSIDSLEPSYDCPAADALFASYGPGSTSPAWLTHLDASAPLKKRLDTLSGVDPDDDDWSRSWDHYFDNLSARLCHDKPLPCSIADSSDCIGHQEADEVFRLGEYEYSFIYRDSAASLEASTASFGVWLAELAANLRGAIGSYSSSEGEGELAGKKEKVKYRHNIAHDGSVSRLLSILQVAEMVWPGMGSEVVFELYAREDCWFVRILWGGRTLVSSHPALNADDGMVPVERVLGYFDGLVGVRAGKVRGLCEGEGY